MGLEVGQTMGLTLAKDGDLHCLEMGFDVGERWGMMLAKDGV